MEKYSMESNQVINEQQVEDFLRENPEFFNHHADLLALMHLPSIHGKAAVSLVERQQGLQREKIIQLERKYNDLLRIGIENDETSNKMHQLTLNLLNANDFAALTQTLVSTLQDAFNVPYVDIKIWAITDNDNIKQLPVFVNVEAALKAWVLSLVQPYCGKAINDHFQYLFNHAQEAKSYAVIPLGDHSVIGYLALASDDEKRFQPDTGTFFLDRLNQLLTAVLNRYL